MRIACRQAADRMPTHASVLARFPADSQKRRADAPVA
jgi:tryptophan halogenase